MMHAALLNKAKGIEETSRTGVKHPFPYSDCRFLLREFEDPRSSGLIPDLDLYFSTIVGCAQSARRLLGWPQDKIAAVRRELEGSFFERHPVYDPLKVRITPVATPELYRRLLVCDQLRVDLLDILATLSSG